MSNLLSCRGLSWIALGTLGFLLTLGLMAMGLNFFLSALLAIIAVLLVWRYIVRLFCKDEDRTWSEASGAALYQNPDPEPVVEPAGLASSGMSEGATSFDTASTSASASGAVAETPSTADRAGASSSAQSEGSSDRTSPSSEGSGSGQDNDNAESGSPSSGYQSSNAGDAASSDVGGAESDTASAMGAASAAQSGGAEAQPAMAAAPTAAAEGDPDDLTRIRGIGPGLQRGLNANGITTFAQIAAWGPAEIDWADNQLAQFKGRCTRDDWVGQARTLASGGTTEFSSRVDRGEVYD